MAELVRVTMPQSAENAVVEAVRAKDKEQGPNSAWVVAGAAALGLGAYWFMRPTNRGLKENPMNKKTKTVIGLGVGAAALAVVVAYAGKKKPATSGVMSSSLTVTPAQAGRSFQVGRNDTVLVLVPNTQYDVQVQPHGSTPAPILGFGEGSGPYVQADGSVGYLLGAAYPGSVTVTAIRKSATGVAMDRLFWNFTVA